MKSLVLALGAFALLSSSCAKRIVIPDPTVPHQVREEVKVPAWCRAPDGKMVKCTIRVSEGWWFASPQVVE